MTSTQTSMTRVDYRDALRAVFGERRTRRPGEVRVLAARQVTTFDDTADLIADGSAATINLYRIVAADLLRKPLRRDGQAIRSAVNHALYIAQLLDTATERRTVALRVARADALCGDGRALAMLDARPTDELTALIGLAAELRTRAADLLDLLTWLDRDTEPLTDSAADARTWLTGSPAEHRPPWHPAPGIITTRGPSSPRAPTAQPVPVAA